MLELRSSGPGPVISVSDSPSPLVSAPLGTAWLIGEFQSGPAGFPVVCELPNDFTMTFGAPNDDLMASMCAMDLYEHAAPVVVGTRVTSGGTAGHLRLFARNPDRSFRHALPTEGPSEYIINAGSVGRWSGCGWHWHGYFGSGSALTAVASQSELDIDSATKAFTLTPRMVDGAQLYIAGDSGSPYTIESYTTATGKLKIRGAFSNAVIAGDGSLTGKFRIVDERDDLELTAAIGVDSTPGETFAMAWKRRFGRKKEPAVVSSFADLVMARTERSTRIAATVLGSSPLVERWSNIESPNSLAADANADVVFPSNGCEIVRAVSNQTVTIQWYRWAYAGDNGLYVHTATPVDAAAIRPCDYTITYSNATTASVVAHFGPGSSQTVALGTLTHGTEFNPTYPFYPKVLIKATGTPEAGDVVVVKFRPFMPSMKNRNGYLHLFAVADDGSAVRYRIASNTYNTVTAQTNRNLATTDNLTAVEAPSVTATEDISAATWTATHTLIFNADGVSKTFTSPGGGLTGSTAILAGLQGQDTDGLFVFAVNSDDQLVVTLARSFGPKAALTIGNGTGNATFGLTNGNAYNGSAGNLVRVEFDQPFVFGLEPIAAVASDYTSNLSAEPDKALDALNLGLVRVAVPGVNDSAVHQGVNDILSRRGWMALLEVPWSVYDGVAVTDLAAAIAARLSTDTFESDYVQWPVPPVAFMPDASRRSTVQRSLAGVLLGRHAALAAVGVGGEKGYQLALAGRNDQGKLSPYVSRVLSGATSKLLGAFLDIGVLDSRGVIPVLHDGQDVYVYGNRLRSVGRDQEGAYYDATDRAVVYHIARALYWALRPVIFRTISQGRINSLVAATRDYLRPLYRDGWFSDITGTGFDDQVSVQAPASLNTADALRRREAYITVQFLPRGSIRAVNVVITPNSVTVT